MYVQVAPRDVVENPRHCSQVLVRLFTKNVLPYLLLQLVSQDSPQELIYTLTYPGVSRSEFVCVRSGFQVVPL